MNEYGVAVRAGSITPQVEDEDAFRRAMKLPAMSADTKKLWGEQGGYRQPITLLRADGNEPVSPTQSSSDNSE